MTLHHLLAQGDAKPLAGRFQPELSLTPEIPERLMRQENSMPRLYLGTFSWNAPPTPKPPRIPPTSRTGRLHFSYLNKLRAKKQLLLQRKAPDPARRPASCRGRRRQCSAAPFCRFRRPPRTQRCGESLPNLSRQKYGSNSPHFSF